MKPALLLRAIKVQEICVNWQRCIPIHLSNVFCVIVRLIHLLIYKKSWLDEIRMC